ncbi:hypothetical protein [Streptomyces olivaceiscleroticus]|uniref:Uncharacterized protein n=1 Tax=Streptomyces olivaceiscleroticus TaxID=68245 RepID=A0ABP3JIB9_9ACTN
MSDSSFEYRQARAAEGAECVTPQDLERYVRRVVMDAHSLRQGLAEAVTQVFAGHAPQELPSAPQFPYPPDAVEAALFDDTMGSIEGIFVADPELAAALRHAMCSLENAAEAADLVKVLLHRPDAGAAMDRLSMAQDDGETPEQ